MALRVASLMKGLGAFNHLWWRRWIGALASFRYDVAVGITQHLDLDVTRLQHVFLDEDAVVTKAVAGFVAAGGEAFKRFLVVESHAQTPPPPPHWL